MYFIKVKPTVDHAGTQMVTTAECIAAKVVALAAIVLV